MTTLYEREVGVELPADECWRLLSEAISSDLSQRAELLASGIAPHTVNALYPASFETFAGTLYSELERQGTEHLRAALISARNWNRIVAIVHRTRTSVVQADENFAAEFAAFDDAPIGELVFQRLYSWHAAEQANDFTHYYLAAVHATYWLVLHPELLAVVNRAEADECARWVVNHLLPGKPEA
jgi:hypothetical protein